MRVDDQLPFQWRDGALVAIPSLANAAGNANWFKGIAAGDIQPIGIDECRRMAHLAPQ